MMPSILSKYRSQYMIEVERDAASPLAVLPEGIIPASLGVCVLIVSFVIISMIFFFEGISWRMCLDRFFCNYFNDFYFF